MLEERIAQGDDYMNFGGKIESCDENVVRGTSVQILPNFPAKSLSIYLNEFFFTLLWLFNYRIKDFGF